MALAEKPPVLSKLDCDSPDIREARAEMCRFLSGQLLAVAEELRAVTLTPWQDTPVARRLDQLREAVDFLRKEVGRLKPKPCEQDDPFAG